MLRRLASSSLQHGGAARRLLSLRTACHARSSSSLIATRRLPLSSPYLVRLYSSLSSRSALPKRPQLLVQRQQAALRRRFLSSGRSPKGHSPKEAAGGGEAGGGEAAPPPMTVVQATKKGGKFVGLTTLGMLALISAFYILREIMPTRLSANRM